TWMHVPGIVTSFCFANPVEALAVGREAETALIRLRCGSMSEAEQARVTKMQLGCHGRGLMK
ncbi:MAG: hypothetical protein RR100_17010, partial [Comamonas sp.]